jgi:OPA family glycerol-3-phosphate transporter-like MFS transporter
MLIGVQALDLAPKKAAGTSAGFTGFFGYMLGTSLLANVAMGYIVDSTGWNGGFIMLIGACILSIIFMGFSWKKEIEINNGKK